jgi:predicted GIY-YIG superfamily endonuclease
VGIVYLIHAERGLHCTGNRYAQHYIGYSSDMMMFHCRMNHHRSGDGARLVRGFNEAGIAWMPVRIWEEGSRSFERYLKKRRNHPKLCPICAVERCAGGFDTVWPEEHAPRFTRRELQVIQAGLRWYRTQQSSIQYLEGLLTE